MIGPQERILGATAFASARSFLEANARPLELARFAYLFQSGPPAAVIAALAEYQNEDGGFGHALEPDLRAPESSALATSVAFQTLRSIGARASDPMVACAVGYLVREVDRATGRWRIIPQSAVASPHAPWWAHANDEELSRRFGLNPTAELLGYLCDYRELVAEELFSIVRDRVMADLDRVSELEMHELLCCLRLLRAPRLPLDLRAPLLERLRTLIAKAVVEDPTRFADYGLHPLDLVDDRDSPFLAGRETAVAANLDHLVSTQGPDGGWPPTWSWGDRYPEEWARARLEWSGIITLDALSILQRFDRIEEMDPGARRS